MTSNPKRPTEAWPSSNLFELGMGYVVVSRFKSSGEAETRGFLIDLALRLDGFRELNDAHRRPV